MHLLCITGNSFVIKRNETLIQAQIVLFHSLKGRLYFKLELGYFEIDCVYLNMGLDMNLSKLWEIVENWGAWHAAVYGVAKSWTQLSNSATVSDHLTVDNITIDHSCSCPIFDELVKMYWIICVMVFTFLTI